VLPLESVPNFSEGRDRAVVDAIGAALAAHADVLDVHSDADHNRSVFTIVAGDDAIVDALAAGIARARESIDLREHDGVHPRIGAADVVPVVPLRPEDMDRAKAAALVVANRVGESGLPVFLYGEVGDGRGPAFYRRGGPDELQRRVDAGELAPAFGPAQLDPAAGGVIVGARRPLIAFNVDLASRDVESAKAIARVVRERDGGLPGVRALGLDLPSAGHAQISMNIEDWEATPPHVVVAAIEREAKARGVELAGAELVGLLPAGALVAAGRRSLRLAGLDESRVLELRLLQ
jgi:glutamate formiminotransferase